MPFAIGTPNRIKKLLELGMLASIYKFVWKISDPRSGPMTCSPHVYIRQSTHAL